VSIRVLIVDDQELVRTGFRLVLETHDDLDVVGEAGDGEEAVRRARQLTPDVVLMDIRMPRMDGIEATTRLGDANLTPPSITRRLIESVVARTDPLTPPASLEELTPRDREVLTLVARGFSNAEIAQRLVVTDATVKSHVGSVLLKLGLRDRVQAVVFAYEHGIVVARNPG